jgi:hypothetical protein
MQTDTVRCNVCHAVVKFRILHKHWAHKHRTSDYPYPPSWLIPGNTHVPRQRALTPEFCSTGEVTRARHSSGDHEWNGFEMMAGEGDDFATMADYDPLPTVTLLSENAGVPSFSHASNQQAVPPDSVQHTSILTLKSGQSCSLLGRRIPGTHSAR